MRAAFKRLSGFQWALLGSALAHLALLFGFALHLPGDLAPVRIEATLRLPPVKRSAVAEHQPSSKPPAPAKAARAGAPRRVVTQAPTPTPAKPSVALPQVAAAPVASAPLGAGGSTPLAEGVAASAPLAEAPMPTPNPEIFPVSVNPEATQSWPRTGTIHYQVRYGETTEVAQMTLTWSHDGERYTLRADTHTVGLARLIKKFDGVQQSQGRVGPEGLAPTGFQEDLNGKQSHAIFDWSAHKIVLSRPDLSREVAISGMAQDILSLAHHLAFQPDGAAEIKLFVVSGRWATEALVTQVASERLRLPSGEVDARHFHCEARNGEIGVDLWLSRAHRNAPVRVRVDDRKHKLVLDEIAQDMELDGSPIHFELTPEEKDLYKG